MFKNKNHYLRIKLNNNIFKKYPPLIRSKVRKFMIREIDLYNYLLRHYFQIYEIFGYTVQVYITSLSRFVYREQEKTFNVNFYTHVYYLI